MEDADFQKVLPKLDRWLNIDVFPSGVVMYT